jgi:hypothetical protein
MQVNDTMANPADAPKLHLCVEALGTSVAEQVRVRQIVHGTHSTKHGKRACA